MPDRRLDQSKYGFTGSPTALYGPGAAVPLGPYPKIWTSGVLYKLPRPFLFEV